MQHPPDELERQLREAEARIEAALEASRRTAERLAASRARIPVDVLQFIEEAAARPQPYTIKSFLRDVYARLPSRWQVASAIVELFQLYLATRALVQATGGDPAQTPPSNYGLSGMGPTPASLMPPAREEMVPMWPHWDARAPAPGGDSVVDAAFAAEARKRQPVSN